MLYLVFNEGYAATAGADHVRADLCDEAIRLGKLLAVLMPDEPEVLRPARADAAPGLAPRARVGADGEIVLLEDQDRSLWDATRIDEGLRVLDRAVSLRRPGPYQLQAAIAAAHAEDGARGRRSSRSTTALAALDPSPVVAAQPRRRRRALRRRRRGLALIDAIEGLDGYHLLHAARADLFRRLDRRDEAAAAYRRALELTTNEAERRYLERRLAEVS